MERLKFSDIFGSATFLRLAESNHTTCAGNHCLR
nr:MAG TPA: hypothetical protein [Caudoviricetes sp.]DAW81760.1 MAG TPA: hypothetical protein [Caudoviricetes sp.]